jgi:hypothetical protein
MYFKPRKFTIGLTLALTAALTTLAIASPASAFELRDPSGSYGRMGESYRAMCGDKMTPAGVVRTFDPPALFVTSSPSPAAGALTQRVTEYMTVYYKRASVTANWQTLNLTPVSQTFYQGGATTLSPGRVYVGSGDQMVTADATLIWRTLNGVELGRITTEFYYQDDYAADPYYTKTIVGVSSGYFGCWYQ